MHMITLEAIVTWKEESEGCWEISFSGIRPSFFVAGDLIAATVEVPGVDRMERGKTYAVVIYLPYEQYLEHLFPGMKTRLQVGARVIASGKVTQVRAMDA